jgi:hypothetical protein
LRRSTSAIRSTPTGSNCRNDRAELHRSPHSPSLRQIALEQKGTYHPPDLKSSRWLPTRATHIGPLVGLLSIGQQVQPVLMSRSEDSD